MKKLLSVIASCLTALSVFMLTACSGNKLIMATGGSTGTYYAYGAAVASVISNNTDLQVSVTSTGASKANLELVDIKEVDLAIVQNDVAFYAYKGSDTFANEEPIDTFSIVASVYSEPCQIVSKSSITKIEDLKGKIVSVGDAGSGVEFNAKQILGAYDISFSDISKRNLSFSESANALKDGQIDAFFCTAGAPTTAVTELSTTTKINVLEVDDAHYQNLMESGYTFYGQYTIPSGTYGLSKAVKTVAVKATIVVANRIDSDSVYSFVKTLFEHNSEIGHDKRNELDFDYAFQGIDDANYVPYHDGAKKYYNEVKSQQAQ